MNYIKYIQIVDEKLKDNIVDIYGTNEILDIAISAQCWPHKEYGTHAGCYKAAKELYEYVCNKLDKESLVYINGHSMGGGIAQNLALIMIIKGWNIELDTMNSYPAMNKNMTQKIPGKCIVYGNCPVSSFFWWFGFPSDVEYVGPERKWWKIPFGWFDHCRNAKKAGY